MSEEKQTAAINPLLMTDFAFGGIEADDSRRLAYEKERWQGVRHEYAIEPIDPLPDQPVTLTVTVGVGAPADHVVAYVTFDGSAPLGRRGEAANGIALPFHRVEVRWEALVWAFVEVWQATIPGQPDGAFVRYDIEAWHSAMPDTSHWSREQNIDRTIDTITHYGYSVDTFTPPEWAKDAVIYQVFADRFRDHRRGDDEHDYLDMEAVNTFWGGTLRGILENLDYIESLGVNVLWVTPFFRTRSYHGYDTTDYYEVDPRFGNKEDLYELVEALHDRGMRFMLDLVVNHVSLDFPQFVSARTSDEAAERAWFRFAEAYPHGYRTFFDVAAMPQLELDFAEARDYMVEVAAYWMREFGVDAYRLDYAAGPSHLFWSWFRRACRAVKPDCWLFGEVTRAGSLIRPYTGRLDGCLDFGFTRAVRRLFSPASGSISEFVASINHARAYFGSDFSLPAFLDNHDMNRMLWMLGNDKQKLRLALALLFGVADSPILYYGTEVGLGQPRQKNPSEESRHPMWWSDSRRDNELLSYTKRWIHERNNHPALRRGDLVTLHLDEAAGTWLVERHFEGDRVFIAANAGAESATIPLAEGMIDSEGNLVAGSIALQPYSALLLAPVAA